LNSSPGRTGRHQREFHDAGPQQRRRGLRLRMLRAGLIHAAIIATIFCAAFVAVRYYLPLRPMMSVAVVQAPENPGSEGIAVPEPGGAMSLRRWFQP